MSLIDKYVDKLKKSTDDVEQAISNKDTESLNKALESIRYTLIDIEVEGNFE